MNPYKKSKQRDNKTELLSGMIVFCLAVILLTILFPKLYGGDFDKLEKITATVTAVNENGNNTQTIFTYKYMGKEYSGSSDQIEKSYVGKKLEIYVDPELPTNIRFQNDLSRILVLLRLLAISVIAIAGYLAIKNKSKEIFT